MILQFIRKYSEPKVFSSYLKEKEVLVKDKNKLEKYNQTLKKEIIVLQVFQII